MTDFFRMIYEKIGSYLLKSLASLYAEDELSFINKCEAIYQISRNDRDHFNELFNCQMPSGLTPKISAKILKVMHKCQLPHEMFYTVHETVMMATDELAEFHNTSKGAIDADQLVPYLILVLVTAFHDLYSENQDKPNPYIIEKNKDGFRIRLILMEYFTVHRASMGNQDYSYVTFKEVEQ